MLLIDREIRSQGIMIQQVGTVRCQTSDILREKAQFKDVHSVNKHAHSYMQATSPNTQILLFFLTAEDQLNCQKVITLINAIWILKYLYNTYNMYIITI